MRKFIYLALVAASSFVLIMQSCKKSSTPTDNKPSGGSFDRKAMLTNLSTNIIIPAYTTMQANAVTLDAAVTAFNTAPDATKLVALQNAFIATYKQWQATAAFDFGPAGQIQLAVNTNTYPASVAQINSNITAGVYNPVLLANLSAKGFPALDYLLFGTGADNTAILAQYTTDSKATNRKTYLASLSAELKTNFTTVLGQWTGAYQATFINASGTDVGSSLGQLTNQVVYDYELLKNFEIGIPAGIQSSGTTYPEKVQGYYSKISLQLTKLHVQAIQNIYTGGTGLGYDDYLIAVNAKYNNGSLNDAIIAQFAVANAKLGTLTDPLSANIISNTTAVTATYTELQKITVFLKADMTSALGILITFGDNDGD